MNASIKRGTVFAFMGGMLASAYAFAGEPPVPPEPPSALCVSIRQELEQTIKTIAALPLEEQARRLDAFEKSHENPSLCNVDRMLEVQDAVELQLARLDVNGTKIMPTKVFRCDKLRTKFKDCNGYYGDDTPSIREGRIHIYSAPPAKTIRIESQWSGAKLECAYIFSSKSAPVCSKNPVLPRPKAGFILVAAYRVGGYAPLRKYVWFIN